MLFNGLYTFEKSRSATIPGGTFIIMSSRVFPLCSSGRVGGFIENGMKKAKSSIHIDRQKEREWRTNDNERKAMIMPREQVSSFVQTQRKSNRLCPKKIHFTLRLLLLLQFQYLCMRSRRLFVKKPTAWRTTKKNSISFYLSTKMAGLCMHNNYNCVRIFGCGNNVSLWHHEYKFVSYLST